MISFLASSIAAASGVRENERDFGKYRALAFSLLAYMGRFTDGIFIFLVRLLRTHKKCANS